MTIIEDPATGRPARDGEDEQDRLARSAWELAMRRHIESAAGYGWVIEIRLQPLAPLAMRNYRHVIHVRKAR